MNNQTLFDKYVDGSHWEKHPTIYADECIAFLKKEIAANHISADTLIVDLGCGNGRDVNHFKQSGIHTEGIDNDTKIIELTKKSYPEHALSFSLYDIHALPYRDEAEVAYYCINVMAYVDAAKVLSEMYRTLKPGGFAFIHFNLLIVDQNYEIDYHQKKSDVYELLKDFEIVEEKIFLREDKVPMPHLHHIMQVIIKKLNQVKK